MKSKIIKYVLALVFSIGALPFLINTPVSADTCPGTSNNTCTKIVNTSTCTTTFKNYIPDHVSKYACELCKDSSTNVKSVGPTWINYPENGVSNSAEPYVHIPSALYPSYLPVHMYATRLGCWGPESDKLSSISIATSMPAVGIMSLKPSSVLTYSGSGLSGYQMNLKLSEYALNYSTHRDPLLDTTANSTLRSFRLLKEMGENVWLNLRDVEIERDYPYGRYYMQYPGRYFGAQINLIEVNNRCNATNQYEDDNYCDLEVYLGASVIDGYALLDQVSKLKIKRNLPPASITFSGNVVSNVSNAKIGETITFNHSMAASYLGEIQNARADYVFGGNTINSPSGPRVIGPISYYKPDIASQSATAIETHTVTLADAQRGYVCRTISWTSSATTPVPTNSPAGRSVQRCVNINYSYELTPSVTVPSTVEPGASISPKPIVKRDGDPLSVNSNWTLTRVILPASNTTDFGTAPVTNATAPSTHYNNLSGTVSELHGSGSNIFSADSTDLALDPAVKAFTETGELQLGQRVCFGLSVRPYTNTSTDYRHSALACVTISKSPSAQIHGGGLLVAEGKVIGSSSKKQSTTFGSWVEYDITANGTVDEMVASAMGYGLQGTALGIGSHLQKLTFANKTVYGNFGSANNLSHSLAGGSLTNPYSFFKDSADPLAALSVAPSGLPFVYGQTKVYTHTGDITLNASTLPLGHQIVLIAENGNIYINGNQTYASGITDPKSLPQLVLIAHNGNIIIDQAVTNVDAWLIANSDPSNASKGQLLTCHSKPKISTDCAKQLVINGPVMVDYLKLYRIHGADFNLPLGYGKGGLNDPAEIFNLRPDAYIWSLQNSQSNTILKTTHIKDLAPRY